ncbi:MAG: hypothetical protein JO366_03720 [Methylobacteriaceae bacterium]|nr:hypothetical protein [Methylobacteriaceae bacterium]
MKAIVELRRHAANAERIDATCRKLDRERNPVHALADLRHDRRIGIGQSIGFTARRRAFDEQLHGRKRERLHGREFGRDRGGLQRQ